MATGCSGPMLGQFVLPLEPSVSVNESWDTLTVTGVFVPGQALAGGLDRLTWSMVNQFDYE